MTSVASAMLVAVNKSIIDLLRDRNSTPHKLPTKIGNLVASAGFSTMPPIKLSMHEIDQALSTRNLSIEARMQIKYVLSKIGVI